MSRLRQLLGGLRHRLARQYWTATSARLATLPPADLKIVQRRARALSRLTKTVADRSGSQLLRGHDDPTHVPLSGRATWAFRPQVWAQSIAPSCRAPVQSQSRLGDALTFYHDDPAAGILARQFAHKDDRHASHCGLILEVFGFAGRFVSAAIDLPDAAWRGIGKSELIRLRSHVVADKSTTITARINVRHGPNTDQILRGIDLDRHDNVVEFDMFYSAIEPDKVSGMWLDIIWENPAMNRIVINDLVLSRHPRANV